jgi:hypothetical protein
MDFIVLDIQPVKARNSILVILKSLFFVASNALINYRNGVMKLSFGYMTLKMNVFNILLKNLFSINLKLLLVKMSLMNLKTHK